ncbi:MAG: tRNA (adenosine(37)-N6)-dimethylallyltransferase MiaA [Clostridia bacterium]|nr:tRNA (adenosine(37)-N6)-dimethylallyltransferase MiaA [Clostridia bacterium]
MKDKVIYVLAGPTASGKSDIALRLAEKAGGEILCMDSMQVYRGMDIGTAKPTAEDRHRVPHHLLDLCSPEDPFSVSDWSECCRPLLRSVRLPILAGGTGLYLDAVSYEQDFGAVAADAEIRARYHTVADSRGNTALYELLRSRDPVAASRLHPNDVRRVVRALEVLDLTGRSITSFNDRHEPAGLEFRIFAVDWPRDLLYRRIDERVDRMMADGLEKEVFSLRQRGVPRDATAIQGLGYKELYDYFDSVHSLSEAVRSIKVRTRHYAKRQLTWFRRDTRIRWIPSEEIKNAPEIILAAAPDGEN